MFTNEISPHEASGTYGSLLQFQLTLGIFMSYCMGIPLPTSDFSSPMNNWTYALFLFPIPIASFQLYFLLLKFKNDTPKWLVENGQADAALEVLEYIYLGARAKSELEKLKESNTKVDGVGSAEMLLEQKKKEVTFKDLFKAPYLKPMMIGCSLSIIQQLSGINVIIFYSTSILKQEGGASNVHYMTAMVGFVNMAATLICLAFVERFGRKIMLLQGTAGMCICNVLTGLFSITESSPWLIVAFILIFLCFFESSQGTVLWIYLSETMEDKAVGLAIALNWIFAGIVVGTLLFFVSPSVLNVYGTFFLYGGLCVIAFFFILVLVPESKKPSKA
mmetsp:Transcript_5389/g.9929  ORF Transcript_5389/g.9929 Transcript_5389/m.9929 type:complete len:333 (-) Transcript_5389:3209-4207(-)